MWTIAVTSDNDQDRVEGETLAGAFSDILLAVQDQLQTLSVRPSSISQRICETGVKTGNPGRLQLYISAEALEDVRGLGFSWEKILGLFGMSRWTIYRRVQSYGFQNTTQFSSMSDAQLDDLFLDLTTPF